MDNQAELNEQDQQIVDTATGTEGDAPEVTGDAADETQTGAPVGGTEGESTEGEGEGELELQFGDEAAPASTEDASADSSTIREIRAQNRELVKKLRVLEAKEKTQQPEAVPALGEKPKLENFDYDEGKFDEALGKWYADKQKVDADAETKRQAATRQQQENQQRIDTYRAGGSRIKGFQEAEDEVVVALSVEQQGILLAGADKPELLVAALGKYPNKLKQLAVIKNPVRFAFAAAKLEKELKVTTRTANKPAPEGRVSSSSGAPSGGGEKKLEQLRADAEKNGDYSKVIAYKAQLKAQSRK